MDLTGLTLETADPEKVGGVVKLLEGRSNSNSSSSSSNKNENAQVPLHRLPFRPRAEADAGPRKELSICSGRISCPKARATLKR